MGLSREELFKKAKELRKKEKEQKSSSESYSNEDYKGVVYTSLPTNGNKILRLLGNPLAMRSKPTDPKMSLISMIQADNGKKFRCIWPEKETNGSWILWRIFDTVMDSTWIKTSDGKSARMYLNEKTHPECFNRVAKNNSDNKFERGWYPPTFININVIDREDKEYHVENKHSKLISKRASEIGDTGNFWYDPGIPKTAYNAIWDDVVEYSGIWDNYDIALRKETESPWYKAYHGLDDRKKLTPEEFAFVVDGPLTEEEKAYELYDLDTMFQVTSYTKIKLKLGEFIKKVDVDFKKNFSAELDALVEKEKDEYAARKEAIADATPEEVKAPEEAKTEAPKAPVKERPTASPTPAPVKQRAVAKPVEEEAVTIDWDALADGSFNGKKYEGVPKMTDDEKSMVLSVNEDGSFEYIKTYKGTELDLLNNPHSDFISPDTFHIDPLNGEEF